MIPNLQATQISAFFITFHTFIVGECREFKFGTQIDHSLSEPTEDKPSLKGAWLWSRDPFKFVVQLKYLWND